MLSLFFRITAMLVAVTMLMAGCTPTFNWREVNGGSIPFAAAFPDKPATLSRTINLAGNMVTMTMTAAEVSGVNFAIGAIEITDPKQSHQILSAMKTALVNNIHGTIKQEKALISPVTSSNPGFIESFEIEAEGGQSQGAPTLTLFARFFAKDKWAYQVIVVGKSSAISRDNVDTFFSSFKLL